MRTSSCRAIGLAVIYEVRHTTRYIYGSPVDLGAHLLHLRPRSLSWQTVLSATLTASPAPARTLHGRDSFGNDVAWMFLDAPHPSFEVTLNAMVEVAAPAPPAETPAWRDVSALAFAGGRTGYEAAEFLFESPMVRGIGAARDYAERSFPPGRPVLEALLDLNARIGRDFTFRAGVTTVGTDFRQVLAQRAGVCQDFSHLMIAGLRALGLPARYVSGYVCTRPPAGQTRRLGADQSHAWVGCWMGPAHGWVDLDPTNGLVVANEHVVLGWGRDFADVSPLRGVILGGGAHRMDVSVDLVSAGETGVAQGLQTLP